MPVHDWTRVEAGIFHAFHVNWIPELGKALNDGLLPPDYYALPEQHYGRPIADVLTLHASTPPPQAPRTLPPATGGLALAEAPPRVRQKRTLEPAARTRRRSLVIRHVSGHRLVALIEIVSPANKDRGRHVEEFAAKVVSALELGIHVLLVDILPPGPHDPQGISGVIQQELEDTDEADELPADKPLTLVSFLADQPMEMYWEHLAVGTVLPEMPLFLRPDRYVYVPLEATYQAAYRGLPAFWRNVLETQHAP